MKPVLIIDDSETMRKIITRSLNKLGIIGIIEAASGAGGLNNLTAFASDAYSLIILDYNLPDRTAVEMITSIRLVEPNMSILVVAAQGNEQKAWSMVEVGANGVIAKPFTVEQLREKLEEMEVIKEETTDGTD